MYYGRAKFQPFKACPFCYIYFKGTLGLLEGSFFSQQQLSIRTVPALQYALWNRTDRNLRFIIYCRSKPPLRQPLFISHLQLFFLLFFLFLLFIWHMCPHPNLPPKRDVPRILAEIIFFFCWRCWAYIRFAFLVFKFIRWIFAASLERFTVKDLSLSLNSYSLLDVRMKIVWKGPTSPLSVLRNRSRFGSLRRSRWVKSFKLQNRYRCLETPTLVCCKQFTESIDEFAISFSFILLRAHLPLITSSSDR